MRKVQAAGAILFAHKPQPSYLLLKHPSRWDLPKGHLDPGESLQTCALREFEEETGISRRKIALDPDFTFETTYVAAYKRFHYEEVEKTLTIFLGYVKKAKAVELEVHEAYAWFRWNPPHRIQSETIDPLLNSLAGHFARYPERLVCR